MKLKNNFIKNYKNRFFKLGLFLLSLFLFFIFSTRISYAGILDLVEYAANPLKFILYLLTTFLYIISTYVLGTILTIASAIFEWSLSLVTSSNTNIVTTGWDVSLNFANMFFILIILAIAIATILGLENYNYKKKALPNLIIVMILINFSMVIGNIPVDISNVLAKYFNSEITAKGGGLSVQLMKSIRITETARLNESLLDNEKAKKLLEAQGDITKAREKAAGVPVKTHKERMEEEGGVAGFVTGGLSLGETPGATTSDLSEDPDIVTAFLTILSTFIFIIIYQLIAIFILLVGAVYMIQRTFWIWLLLMIAPLAWLAYAIPGLNQYFTMWWKKFLAWCFFAPVFLFFTFLSIVVSYSSFGSLITGSSAKDLSSLLSANAGNFMQLLAVAFVMTFGIVAGQKMGVGGSNFVLNYANKAKGAASKKFSELRSKTPFTAEKLGAKFGGLGAGILAKSRIGAVAGYGRETRERLEMERIQEQQTKERLVELRKNLDMETNRDKRMVILKQIRGAAGGKSPLDKIKDILKEGEEKTAPKEPSKEQPKEK